MSIQQDYTRAIRTVSAIPGEVRAVPSYSGVLRGLGQAEAAMQVQGMEQARSRVATEAALAEMKQDRKLAGTDSKIALGIGAVNVGLNAVTAHDMKVQAHNTELADLRDREMIEAMRITIQNHPKEIEQRLLGIHPSQKAGQAASPIGPASTPNPIGTERDYTMEQGGL